MNRAANAVDPWASFWTYLAQAMIVVGAVVVIMAVIIVFGLWVVRRLDRR